MELEQQQHIVSQKFKEGSATSSNCVFCFCLFAGTTCRHIRTFSHLDNIVYFRGQDWTWSSNKFSMVIQGKVIEMTKFYSGYFFTNLILCLLTKVRGGGPVTPQFLQLWLCCLVSLLRLFYLYVQIFGLFFILRFISSCHHHWNSHDFVSFINAKLAH